MRMAFLGIEPANHGGVFVKNLIGERPWLPKWLEISQTADQDL